MHYITLHLVSITNNLALDEFALPVSIFRSLSILDRIPDPLNTILGCPLLRARWYPDRYRATSNALKLRWNPQNFPPWLSLVIQDLTPFHHRTPQLPNITLNLRLKAKSYRTSHRWLLNLCSITSLIITTITTLPLLIPIKVNKGRRPDILLLVA